ncbi:hypothetical protein NY08_513 [Rhodococcus sp. B7740]|nr:hypothetical protein [Rhodococcus sp. B7740]AJW38545.1 hypothetical protein NY08_513 [Rhodococcus sp. B7740]
MSRTEIGSVAVALGLATSAVFFVAFRVTSAAVAFGEVYLERRGRT